MGRIAARRGDFVVATSDNPRTEDPGAILEAVEEGLKLGTAEYRVEPDRREAIRIAVRRAAPGDIVVVAGKGHEDYQVIGKTTVPFDDRVVTRELIEESLRGGAAS
jgi:UDP-N-acetylmuramoyl-L-alanyl-D-glutamate--2,6-diaminopimelate ligase